MSATAPAPAPALALLIIDAQRDFGEPSGALYVPDGGAVVGEINALRAALAPRAAAVVLTQDWHPPDHLSFAANNGGAALFSLRALPGGGEQVMWPTHCVAGSAGADFLPALVRAPGDVLVRKGGARDVDSYSGFGSPSGAGGARAERTELEAVLRARGVTHVVLAGLALDFCVAFTARDAAALGFKVCVARHASRGIAPDSLAREARAMADAGVEFADSLDDVLAFAERARELA